MPLRKKAGAAAGQWAQARGRGIVNQIAGDQTVHNHYYNHPIAPGGQASIGFLRLIVELTDPFALEVQRSIQIEESSVAGLGELPRYAPRDLDRQLAGVVAAAAGGHSMIAVLVGDSSTGKTRACWEAIHTPDALPQGWRLWHPIDPGRPRALLNGLDRVPPRTVVWLNDAHHYLLTQGSGLGEEVAAGLIDLLRDPDRAPVLVLGTLWRPEYGTLSAMPRPGSQDLHQLARQLLAGAEIEVPEAFAGSDLDAAKEAARSDPLMALAVEKAEAGRVTQYLAGTLEQERRYRSAQSPVKALLEAAIDARLLGIGPAIPRSVLMSGAPGYLTDSEWGAAPDGLLEEALAECTERCRGAAGPLTFIRARPGEPDTPEPRYRLAGHIEQLGSAERAGIPAPSTLWTALLDHGPAEDRTAIGLAAHARGYFRIALELHSGTNTTSLQRIAELLDRSGHPTQATACYRYAADAGDPSAIIAAAEALERSGRVDEAVDWLSELAARFYACTWTDSVNRFVAVCALGEAAGLLERAGRTDDSIAFCRRLAEYGYYRTMGDTAAVLERAGRLDEAVTCHQRAVEAGDAWVVDDVADVMERAGRSAEEISAWMISLDGNDALDVPEIVAAGLERAGRLDEAIVYYRRAADDAFPGATRNAVRLMEMRGRAAEAISWITAYAEDGDPEAMAALGWLLERTGHTEDAKVWADALADGAPESVARSMQEEGDPAAAILLHQRAAETGTTASIGEAALLLENAGRTGEAVDWLFKQLESGHLAALDVASTLIENAGGDEEAERLRRYGRDPGGAIAQPWPIDHMLPRLPTETPPEKFYLGEGVYRTMLSADDLVCAPRPSWADGEGRRDMILSWIEEKE